YLIGDPYLYTHNGLTVYKKKLTQISLLKHDIMAPYGTAYN
ncbi:20142_t:CDS:1, partial [Racocetra fulgida]